MRRAGKLRHALLGLAGCLSLSGLAFGQGSPWVSLSRDDLAPCEDTLAQFQSRWLSSLAIVRNSACANDEQDECSRLSTLMNAWQEMSPADFMMEAPSDCPGCGNAHMIDQYVDAEYSASVPFIIMTASGTRPGTPPRTGGVGDARDFEPAVRHCLAGLWVAKLFATGQTLSEVKLTADEAGFYDTTPDAFADRVRDLTQVYGGSVASARPARPVPAPAPGPAPPAADPVRAAIRACGDPDLSPQSRIEACSIAIAADVAGAERVLAYWARSVMRLEAGDIGGAIADADIAGELQAEDYSVQNARCWSRAVGAVELETARQACTMAIRLAPEEASVHDSRGLVGLRQQRWSDALSDYSEALVRSPDFASALYGRGLAALGMGLREQADADLLRAVAVDPGIAAEYQGLGLTPQALAPALAPAGAAAAGAASAPKNRATKSRSPRAARPKADPTGAPLAPSPGPTPQ